MKNLKIYILIAVAALFILPNVVSAQKKKSGENKIMKFGDTKIKGQIERPEAVYIIDVTDPTFKPIRIERSFQDEILEPVDKEMFEEELMRKENKY